MPTSTPYNNNNNVHYSRRLLFHSQLYTPHSLPAISDPTPESDTILSSSFDSNLVMILAVLLCALTCALVLNSIVRCVLRCSNRFGLDRSDSSQAAPTGPTRFRRKALRSLPIFAYSADLKLPGTDSECAVCLSELIPGERIRVLPKCSHGFHVKCIDKWLMARSSCPICRQCLFAPSKKSSSCTILVPLEPEGLIHDYRGYAF